MLPSRVRATIASTSASAVIERSPACSIACSSAASSSLRPVPTAATSVFAASRAIPRPRACASPSTKATASSSFLSASNLWAHPPFLHALTSFERPSMPLPWITSTVVGLGDWM
jgi:hypothetical protein